MTGLEEARALLRDRWGLEFSRVRAVVHELGNAVTPDELIARCRLSQRAVTEILDHLQPFVCRDGERVRLTDASRDPALETFGPPLARRDPWDEAAGRHPLLPEVVADLAGRPGPNRHLDQVAATAVTVVKRALFLSQRFDLTGATVLMLGDHDMTALALARLAPDAAIAVADVDERVLEFVGDVRRRHGWPIETFFTDLRLELPRSLAARFDLVFTDPPYTPAGMKLFLLRGIQALNERAFSRICAAYGAGEQQAALALKVQAAIGELRLVIESIEPGFNEYGHAPALGNRSDLYVLRPTRRSSAAAKRWTGAASIYSRGHAAKETPAPEIPAAVIERLGRYAAPERTVVADANPAQLASVPAAERMSLAAYLSTGTLDRCRQAVIANLYPNHEDFLVRLCLRSQAQELAVCATQRTVADLFAHPGPLRRLIEIRFEVTDRLQQGNVGAVCLKRRLPDGEDDAVILVLHGILVRPRSRLVSAWRESLISWSRTQGHDLTKNQARLIISESRLAAEQPRNDIADLPGAALQRLIDDIAASIDRALP